MPEPAASPTADERTVSAVGRRDDQCRSGHRIAASGGRDAERHPRGGPGRLRIEEVGGARHMLPLVGRYEAQSAGPAVELGAAEVRATVAVTWELLEATPRAAGRVGATHRARSSRGLLIVHTVFHVACHAGRPPPNAGTHALATPQPGAQSLSVGPSTRSGGFAFWMSCPLSPTNCRQQLGCRFQQSTDRLRVGDTSDAKNHLSEVVDRLEREHGRVVITKHGRPTVVMLSLEDLESLEETLDILSNPSLVAEIHEAQAETAAGRTRELTRDQAQSLINRQ